MHKGLKVGVFELIIQLKRYIEESAKYLWVEHLWHLLDMETHKFCLQMLWSYDKGNQRLVIRKVKVYTHYFIPSMYFLPRGIHRWLTFIW